MRTMLSFVFLVSLIGCGSKSGDAVKSAAGVTLSINNPTDAGSSQQKAEPAETLGNPAVEQLIKKARAAVVAGQNALAVEALSQAIGVSPGDARLFRMRADVYVLMGENANARADFSLAVRAEPQNAELYNVRGYFLMTNGASADALTDFNKAIELNPKLAPAWNNRGLVHLANSSYEAAESDFGTAVELDNTYVDALNNRGFARLKLGRLDEALVDLKQTVKMKPDYTTAWNNCGLVYLQQENFTAAVEAFSEAVRLAPMDARWLNHRRAVYLKLEQFENATSDGRKIEWLAGLARLTNEATARSGDPQAWINRAVHLAAGSQFGAAVQDYSRALSLDPANTRALNGRAQAWLNTGDLKKAIADCDESLVVQPSTTAFSVRGDAWYALQNFDQAIEDFEAAKRFDEGVAAAYRSRADLHEQAGRKELAVADRQKADQIDAGLAGQLSESDQPQQAVPFPEE